MHVDAATYYNSIALGYNQLHAEEQRRKLQRLFSSFSFSFSSQPLILDVGCGTGISSTIKDYLLQQGIQIRGIIGIDPSLALLKQNPYPKVLGVAEALPFPDNLFDLVISLTAAQNFSDLQKGLREIARVTKTHAVVSLLKKSPKAQRFLSLMHEFFAVEKSLEEEKDLIVIARKKSKKKTKEASL